MTLASTIGLSRLLLAETAFVGYTGSRRPPAPALPVPRLRKPALRFQASDRGGAKGEPKSEAQEPQADLFPDVLSWISGALAFLSGLLASAFALLGGIQGSSSPQRERPARIVQQSGAPPVDAQSDAPVYSLGAFPRCTEASDLRSAGRRVTIVTTAALPWRTGPAVNALLRGLHLAKQGSPVVLRLPWVEPEAQKLVFSHSETFPDKRSQEEYICQWCVDRAGISLQEVPLTIRWYDATYVEAVRSIFPIRDISQDLGPEENDVLILEEPEHLCWYHTGQRWPELFRHVVGVVHTNYQVYLADMGYEGLLSNPSVRDSILLSFTSLVCSAYCDVTVKLSSAGVAFPNDVISNINGVRKEFFDIGDAEFGQDASVERDKTAAVYFVGKAVFPKGWSAMLALLEDAGGTCADLKIDAFGSGPDWEAIAEKAEQLRNRNLAQLRVSREVDHADKKLRSCRVLANASTSEILCTVTAEALAMRKRVVLPSHPSNRFFLDNFADRCHAFEAGDAAGFEQALRAALAAGPAPPLSETQRELLSWDTAVDRLCSAAQVHVLSGDCTRPSEVRSARVAYTVHHGIQKDTPSLGKLLKDATLKERSPWEETFAQWRETEYGRQIFSQAWSLPSWDSLNRSTNRREEEEQEKARVLQQ